MDLYTAINDRRSIRKYKPDPVPQDTLVKLLDAARAAPSWANKQCWRFLVVKDAERKKELADSLPEGNPAAKAVANAPVVVVACADPEASGSIEGKDYYLLDVGIAMQQLVLAAHAEGLGTCWVAWMDEAAIRKACDVPDAFRVVALTPLGYPDKEAKPTPRKDLSEIAFEEKWGQNIK